MNMKNFKIKKSSILKISHELNSFKQPVFIMLLAILTVFAFKDFIGIGFTNSDDTDNFVRALKGDLVSDAGVWARGQGRFFFYYRCVLASIPYLIDNLIWQKCFQYIPVFFDFVLFSYIISKVFHSEKIGYAVYTLLLIFLSVPSDGFSLPIAYPFLFSFDLFCFLLASLFLMKYFQTKRYKDYWLFIIFFAVPFYGYEAYFVFFIFFFIWIFIKGKANGKIKNVIKSYSLKEILPLVLVVLLFYFIYFLYRINIDSIDFYSGNTIATNFKLSNFFYLLYNINKSAYPTYIFYNSFEIFKNYYYFENTLMYPLFHLSKLSLLNSALLSGIFTFLIYKTPLKAIAFNKTLKYILFSLLLSYSINITLAISEKYQQYYEMTSYCTTFFAYIGVTLAILLFFLLIIKLFNKNPYSKIIISLIIVLVLFFISSMISFSNNVLNNDWRVSQVRFTLIDNTIDSKGLNDIPANAIIFDSTLYITSSILGKGVTGNTFSWQKYLNTKTSNSFQCFQSYEQLVEYVKLDSLNRPIYSFNKFEFPDDEIYFLIISKIDRRSLIENNYLIKNLKIFSLGKKEKIKNYYLKLDDTQLTFNLQEDLISNKYMDKDNVDRIQLHELSKKFFVFSYFVTNKNKNSVPCIEKNN